MAAPADPSGLILTKELGGRDSTETANESQDVKDVDNASAATASRPVEPHAEKAVSQDQLDTDSGVKKDEDVEAAAPIEEVWWDEPADQDPENPMNWPDSRKWGVVAILSSITFIT